jgi:hypothetical protein
MGAGYGAIDAARDTDPLTLGQLFCAARISDDMAPIEPYFAPKLVRRLAEAPAGAAIPWQTFPDRPTTCSAAIVNGYDDTIGVLVQITYEAGARHWSDTLNLERTPDSWRLNNVFYQTGGNLRFRLVEN